jgi:hypothetical protein
MGTYHEWEAASNSRLTHLMRSPAHLKAYMGAEHRDTPALAFGRAAHAAILEPDTFEDRYVTAGRCLAVTTKGTQCTKSGTWPTKGGGFVCSTHVYGAAYEPPEQANTVEVLSTDDHRHCLGMRDAVHRMKRAHGMLTGQGEVEMSIRWNDPETGVPCKARLDRHSPELAGGAIVDLKTTRNASPLDFERAIFSFGYHRQAAFYLMGAKAMRLPARHFSIIAVEKEPPYGVAIYRLTEGAVQGGEDQVRPLLRRYAECIKTDSWPCYPDEVRDISLPAYAWNQLSEQVEDVA